MMTTTNAPEIREKPIIFSGPMIRAILDGKKTQTRRVVKPQPEERRADPYNVYYWQWGEQQIQASSQWQYHCPYGKPGDRLWVREGFRTKAYGAIDEIELQYLASVDPAWDKAPGWTEHTEYYRHPALRTLHWVRRSPIFMPRWACRLVLEVASIRVERLQAITEDDARAEGIARELVHPGGFDPDNFHPPGAYGYVSGLHPFPEGRIYPTAKEAFAEGWDSINAKRGYSRESNPWVWAITFKRMILL